MISRRKPQAEDNVDSWLMSYADMITLLLAFFVVFIATSEPKQEKLSAATQGLRETFGALNLETPFDGMYKNLLGNVASNRAERNVAVSKMKDAVELEISTGAFFAPGSAVLEADAMPALQDIAATLKNASLAHYDVVVEAHTSTRTLESAQQPSNWELSAARAARIARLLVEAGVTSKRISARGYAGTQPLVPNTDAAGNAIPANQLKNERVVVRIVKP